MIAPTKPDMQEDQPALVPTVERQPLPVRAQAALLFIATAAVYWVTATRSNTFDAVAYANQIGLAARMGTVRGLFHPHHLLFNALGFLAWRLARAGGYSGGPLVVLQRINATVAAAGVTVFFLALRRHVPHRAAWLGTLLLAASFGWWVCATDGRVNTVSAALLLAAFASLCGLLRAPSVRGAALCGTLSGAALLFHESAGLFVAVGLAGTALAAPRPRAWRLAVAYGGAWAATVLLPYTAVSVLFLRLHSLSAFRHWVDAYAESGQWWDFHLRHNLRLDGYALRHAVLADPPRLPALRLLYASALAGWLVALAGLAFTLPRLLRSTHRRLALLCLLWLGAYGAFFTVWCPGYFVFWVPALVPLIVLLALALTRQRAWRLGWAWVALCAAVNLTCSVAPHLRPPHEVWDVVTADARAHTGPRDLLIVPGAGPDGPCEVFLPYFAGRACLSVHESLNQARGRLADAPTTMQARVLRALLAGRRVYVYGESWADPVTLRDLERHHPGLTAAGVTALFAPFRRDPAWTGPRGPVYRLRLIQAPAKGQPAP